jgi:hypothetical protein
MGKQGWYQTWCQGSRAGNALEPWHKPKDKERKNREKTKFFSFFFSKNLKS